MLITVSSSFLLGILLWGFINTLQGFYRHKDLYGDMGMYGVPSIEQTRRYRRAIALKTRLVLYTVAIVIVFTSFIISFF